MCKNEININLTISSAENKYSSLVGPLQIIDSRLGTSHLGDEPLHRGPKPKHLQRIITPASRDTEVSLMRGHMMYSVVLSRKNDLPVLELLNNPRETLVHVRPLMNLVCEGDEKRECH